MEGYLHKKGRGEKTFGRRNWKKRWFILDGQYLTYYEDFDVKAGKPTSKKGTFLMKGCDIKLGDSKERPFSFAIVGDGQTPMFLDAESEKVMKLWMSSLKNAAMGIYGLSKRTDFSEYLGILGIPADMMSELTTGNLTKQYRKISLKAHPDKGGDVDEYERIQEAYNLLKSHLEEQEQAKMYDTIHYEIIVEKGGPGIGLGMMVVEDKKNAQIYLKSKQPNIIVRKLDAAAGGDMMVGDVLVGIDDDNTVTWTLARVVQRLNDFRVPVGSTVRLTFSRRVPKGGIEGDDEPPSPQTASPPTRSAPSVAKSPSPPKHRTPAKSSVVDSDDYFASPAAPNPKSPESRSSAASANRTARNTAASLPSQVSSSGTGGAVSQQASQSVDGFVSVIAFESIKAVNEELTDKVDSLEESLRVEKEANEKLKADVVALSSACKKLKKEEMRLKLHIQQLMSNGGATVSDDQLADSAQNMADVAGRIRSGEGIPNSPDTEKYLDIVGLRSSGPPGSVSSAQRSAISAAAAVDPTGLVLKKWVLSGDPAMSKLSRLEERLKKMQESSSPYHSTNEMSASIPPPAPPLSQLPPEEPAGYMPAPASQPSLTASQLHAPPPPSYRDQSMPGGIHQPKMSSGVNYSASGVPTGVRGGSSHRR